VSARRRPNLSVRGFALIALVLSVAASCTPTRSDTQRDAGGDDRTIVVGVSGAFTENELVAEMYADVLEHAGYTVQRRFDLRSREVSQSALESGEIDLKPEYLSSLLLYLDPNAPPSSDRNDVLAQDAELLGSKGISVLTPASAEDTNVFVVNAETAQRFTLTTMSSLAAVANQLTLGAPPECVQRYFCLPGLHDVYGILFYDFKPLDAGGPQTVAALTTNDVQVGLLFSTDPSIEASGFVPLVDDRHLQNAENLTPVIRTDKLNGEIRDALDSVSAALTSDRVTALVGKVVLDGQDVETVARDFLVAHDLL
jgi:osmoprotectant transport system substrate-binding protein